ncbi:MAG: peptidylprolyl isomerase [Calothrix sp. C42_A2020_038]|nr:peptidylprolyl isomerase [Calothrix sp. C42_A2020_038]
MSDFKTFVEAEEVVDYLKQEMSFQATCQNILYQRLIARVAQERRISVSSEEIETEATKQRRERRLEKAADTIAWLTDNLITPHDWEVGIRNRLLAQKLAEEMFGKEVEKFFIQNRTEFEQVILYRMVVADEKLAQELYYQIEEREISFYAAAHNYDVYENRRQRCGYEGKIYRWEIETDIASVVFNTSPQQLIGPLKIEQDYHLLWVDELIPAELTPQRYQELLNHMLKQWLNTELSNILES